MSDSTRKPTIIVSIRHTEATARRIMYTIDDIRQKAIEGAHNYNHTAKTGRRLSSVSLFGSYANGNAREDSDVDLLVAFETNPVSLFDMAKVLSEMENAFGSPVDIVKEPLAAGSFLAIDKKVPLYG